MWKLSWAVAVLAVAVPVAAQQMPDPSQMAGRPLPAPELATGTVSVRVVRERMGNNITNQPVSLKAANRTLNATTDGQGRATFGDVPPGTTITVETTVDGETLRSQEFAVPPSGGVRVALIAGLAAAAEREGAAREAAAKEPPRRGIVVFGGESRVILEFQDDNLQVFYLLDIVNNARAPIDVGEPLFVVLPKGAVGAGALDGSSPLAVVQGDRIRISGPFPPGETQVHVGYRFPYSGDTATLTQPWPAAFEQLFVAAEKIGNLQISSPQFEQQQEANAGGSPFLMATGGRLNAGEALTITLAGLPHRNRLMRNIGLGIGLCILAAGFWAAFGGSRRRTDHAGQLAQRKEKLMADLVALEEQHRQGRVDERRYASRRQSLVSQLERVLGEIEHPTTHSPRRGGPADGEGQAA
jgi:hypothetical protein